MDWLHLLILAILQGLTEFLPISSSAHLILPAKILGWPDQGPLIDVMAHLGSLGAVIIYYRKDVARMIAGGFDLLSFKGENWQKPQAKLAFHILIATPPTLIVGLLMSMTGWAELVRSPLIIAWAMIGFGIVLWLVDVWGKKVNTVEGMNWQAALLIGLAQMIAFIPGTSRSGITMTAARGLGYTRSEAARFSMLLAIPTILASGSYAFLKLLKGGGGEASLMDGVVVAALSLVAAYFAIYVFMKLIDKVSFFPFMIYRLVLGVLLLWWLAAHGGA
ncbi:MAG: undecaprenyl-diphosphate phosphatase [Robiginitomaculum sp.]|nr:undecaprenyl-diphosphate phosphatase [Robiginitomaculum sp.]